MPAGFAAPQFQAIKNDAMLPLNQDLPEQLFTLPKPLDLMGDNSYASKDSLKLCDRLKVEYGEIEEFLHLMQELAANSK